MTYQLVLTLCAVAGVLVNALVFAYRHGKHVQLLEDQGKRISRLEYDMKALEASIALAITASESRMVSRIDRVNDSIHELRNQLIVHFQKGE